MHRKYIYTKYIYRKCMIFSKKVFYVMVILWVCYGYPMVSGRNRVEIGLRKVRPPPDNLPRPLLKREDRERKRREGKKRIEENKKENEENKKENEESKKENKRNKKREWRKVRKRK